MLTVSWAMEEAPTRTPAHLHPRRLISARAERPLLCLLPPVTPHDNVDRLAAAAAADGEKPSSDGRRVNATIATAQAAHALVVVQVMMFLPVL